MAFVLLVLETYKMYDLSNSFGAFLMMLLVLETYKMYDLSNYSFGDIMSFGGFREL